VIEIKDGKYPKSHLWGFTENKENILNPIIKNKVLDYLSEFYDKVTKKRFGNLKVEISILYKRKYFCGIYCVSGHLFIIPILKRLKMIDLKLALLVYKLPKETKISWKLHNLHLSPFLLKAYEGINCLTTHTSKRVRKVVHYKCNVKYLPWCTDNFFFQNEENVNETYFFASGKTNRDYKTLIKACESLPHINFIFIGTFNKKIIIPNNVRIINSVSLASDTTVSYAQLKNLYKNCMGVCISLNPDPEDTCGYTEMLEALSMGKPVLMTRSGCLDLDLEKEKCGFYIESKKANDWVRKIQLVYSDPKLRKCMSKNGSELINSIYNLKAHRTSTRLFLNQSFRN
jgi:glycosyltransferase involved in cell wall biosynthesis